VAGLTAAIQLKKAGFDPVIFEKESKVGAGRHGDYEGLDNWIFSRNVPTFFKQSAFKFNDLTTYPISRFFVHTLFGKPITIQNNQPFFYMVKRGSGINDLDYQLYRQCKEIGVRFELGKKAPETCHIIATGSRKAAAYIRGINFKTTLKNQVHLLLGSQFAPKGYAYLIIINGNGTLATAFKKPKNTVVNFLQNARAYFNETGISVPNEIPFGSRGSFSLPFGTMFPPYKIGEAGGIETTGSITDPFLIMLQQALGDDQFNSLFGPGNSLEGFAPNGQMEINETTVDQASINYLLNQILSQNYQINSIQVEE